MSGGGHVQCGAACASEIEKEGMIPALAGNMNSARICLLPHAPGVRNRPGLNRSQGLQLSALRQ